MHPLQPRLCYHYAGNSLFHLIMGCVSVSALVLSVTAIPRLCGLAWNRCIKEMQVIDDFRGGCGTAISESSPINLAQDFSNRCHALQRIARHI